MEQETDQAEPPRAMRYHLLEVLTIAVVLAIVLGVGYYYLGYRNAEMDVGRTAWRPKIGLDDSIPFAPIWIWPYLLYFPLCVLPLVLCTEIARYRRIALSYLLAYGPPLVLFVFLPTVIDRPTFEVTGPSTAILAWMYEYDPGYNILPSLHVTNAVLVGWLFQRLKPRWAPPVWLAAAAVAVSTVLVKQHYFIDVPAGIVWGTVAFFAAFGRAAPEPELAPG